MSLDAARNSLQRVSLHDVASQRWRNGGGDTRELLSWPPPPTRAAPTRCEDPHGAPQPTPAPPPWRLRVSVATIARSGPFSQFAGVVRWFAVLDGRGVRLSLPHGETTLLAGDDPIVFDGDAAPQCQLLDGATHDLNLMVRRDAGTPRLRRAAPGDAIASPTRWRAAFAMSPVLLQVGGTPQPLAAGTLAWSDADDASPWRLLQASHGCAWFMTLEA